MNTRRNQVTTRNQASSVVKAAKVAKKTKVRVFNVHKRGLVLSPGEAAVHEDLASFLFGTKRASAKVAVEAHGATYTKAFMLPLAEQATVVKQGIRPRVIKVLADDMGINQGTLASQLGLAKSTFGRKLKDGGKLSAPDSEKALGVVRLIGLVQKMVEDSDGPADFDAAEWVGHWLEQPLLALGGDKPGSYMDTAAGQQLVANLLHQAQAGSYA